MDRIQALTMARKALRLKPITREISERRQVGDAADMLAGRMRGREGQPWWKNVTMEEGM